MSVAVLGDGELLLAQAHRGVGLIHRIERLAPESVVGAARMIGRARFGGVAHTYGNGNYDPSGRGMPVCHSCPVEAGTAAA